MTKMKMKRTGVEKLLRNSSREVAGGEGQQLKSSIETPDGVRALEVPKSDAGSGQDEAPGKDKTVNTL